MDFTIFGKPLSDVTYQDVADFCGLQKSEGINLDYKRDLSSSKPIVKTIAAFANTRGGYIIVGVEDENDKPKLPATGMNYVDSLPLTITNMLVDNLYPYFAPQVRVCEPVDGKTFVIIHVPESVDAPHWLFNRTELYVRRGDRSSSGDWERFATEQEWEFLRNKREKSLDLRAHSVSRMDRVFCQENLNDLRSQQPPLPSDRIKVQWDGLLKIRLVPLFPTTPLADATTLHGLLMSQTVNDIHRGSFPRSAEKKVFQSGAYQYVSRREQDFNGVSNFTAIDEFGGLISYERILHQQRPDGSSIFASHVVALVEACTRYMSKIYGELGYHGNLGIEVIFDGPENVALELLPDYMHRDPLRNLLGRFEFNGEIETFSLGSQEARYDLLAKVMKQLLYSFGSTMVPNGLLDDILSDSAQYHDFIVGRSGG